MQKIKVIVIIDPIFRGSRLYYSWIISSYAEQKGHSVIIVTRTSAVTDHALEYFSNCLPQLEEVVELPDEFWYGYIRLSGSKAIVRSLSEQLAKYNVTHIFFPGLNELYPSIFIALILQGLRAAVPACELTFIDYDPTWMRLKRIKWLSFYKSSVVKSGLRQLFRHLLLVFLKIRGYKIRIGILDEYLFAQLDKEVLAKRYGVSLFCLPDPPPPVKIELDSVSRSPQDYLKISLLLVGLQSSRKGLEDVLLLLEKYAVALNGIQFVLSGRLDADMEVHRSRLVALGDLIVWYDDYVSDQEIQKRYAQSDYVILPYKKSFSSSSGVLATASAIGVPIIATDHGLLGRRVVDHKLGFVYSSGDILQLRDLLLSLPVRDTVKYALLSNHCRGFAESCSIDKFADQVLSY